ncbi:hypothetical protein [Streptomyces sp. McG2]|uniref:hypothetical protein n=1 Tax=Streptomyces sp. McG2 TaxID=2725482 RepID=UPI001BE63A92|nr:hypothetical protein [Streptomyces sp. McG2]MBT2891053.1 hypothetical protein [Streptomyces sp. McG2]
MTGASPVVGGNSGSKVTPPVPSSSVARVSGSPPSGSVEEAVNSQPGPAFREPDTSSPVLDSGTICLITETVPAQLLRASWLRAAPAAVKSVVW